MRVDISKHQYFEVVEYGEKNDEVILMISGLGQTIVAWPQEMIDQLVKNKFRVICFDNRDTGHSIRYHGKGFLGKLQVLWKLLLFYLFQIPPYQMADMADDTYKICQALNLKQVHLIGWSMGGVISQHFILKYPSLCKSLILLMSSPGVPIPHSDVLKQFGGKGPKNDSIEARVENSMIMFQLVGSPKYPEPLDKLRERLTHQMKYCDNGGVNSELGMLNQFLSIKCDINRKACISKITIPTLILHGDSDKMIEAHEAYESSQLIPNSKLKIYEGLGHDFPYELVPEITTDMCHFIKQQIDQL